MKKILSLVSCLAGLALAFGLSSVAVAAVNPTPSTNDINRTNGWAHVDQLSQGVGTTDLNFISTRAFYSCFEYRTDGDTGQILAENGGNNYNALVTDGLYPYYCEFNTSEAHAISANSYVEVRMVFGAEADERFDWTRFDVLPAPATGSLVITKYSCPDGTVVNRTDNGVGKSVPGGCVADSGKFFGYVHGNRADAGGPWDDLYGQRTEVGVTDANGVLTIPNLPVDGLRYWVVETNGSNQALADGDILGLYCEGDEDPNPNHNDNADIAFVPAGGTANCVAYDKLATPPLPQLTALSPANIWLGLKNSDDVGTKFDLEAKVFKNGTEVGSGLLLNQNGGSSGFNNASLRAIALTLAGPTAFSLGDTLSIKLSVRIAIGIAGHRSGTARLWFNDSQANSMFDATIEGVDTNYYLRDGSVLGPIGTNVKKTSDVFVDKLVNSNAFKPFGTWSITL